MISARGQVREKATENVIATNTTNTTNTTTTNNNNTKKKKKKKKINNTKNPSTPQQQQQQARDGKTTALQPPKFALKPGAKPRPSTPQSAPKASATRA